MLKLRPKLGPQPKLRLRARLMLGLKPRGWRVWVGRGRHRYRYRVVGPPFLSRARRWCRGTARLDRPLRFRVLGNWIWRRVLGCLRLRLGVRLLVRALVRVRVWGPRGCGGRVPHVGCGGI